MKPTDGAEAGCGDVIRGLNVVEMRPRVADDGGKATELQISPEAKAGVMRFFNGPRADVNAYRISALFETEPELDGVVGSIIRNGFRYIADLNTVPVKDVFANSDARLDERRRVIERLKRQAGVRLVS